MPSNVNKSNFNVFQTSKIGTKVVQHHSMVAETWLAAVECHLLQATHKTYQHHRLVQPAQPNLA